MPEVIYGKRLFPGMITNDVYHTQAFPILPDRTDILRVQRKWLGKHVGHIRKKESLAAIGSQLQAKYAVVVPDVWEQVQQVLADCFRSRYPELLFAGFVPECNEQAVIVGRNTFRRIFDQCMV